MKNLILFFMIMFSSFVLPQWTGDPANNQPLDINSKASELGITPEHLNGILSSVENNGGGEPLPDAMQENFFTGQAAGDNFGAAVANAGDVNGDGYDDLIVGAYLNDANGSDAGRAYIYFGGMVMDNVADVLLTGTTSFNGFGISVSGAGDVNADGYEDVIVGELYGDASIADAGSAYIFLGGTIMNNTADVILSATEANEVFGASVSTAGDVNGDGYSDVIVGARYNDIGGTDAGCAYIYYGGASMNNIADVTATGETAGDFFGGSVSTAGDINGDGYSDVIVGATWYSSLTGRAYIYFGGAVMNITADVVMTGQASSDLFGNSVSEAGDVNGDGYSDVIVGAPNNDVGGTDAGASYIYFGGTVVNNTADVVLMGLAAGDYFGYTVAGGGDLNGDGYSDVIVGAIFNDAGGTDAGRAYIYFGETSMDNVLDVILTGKAAGDYFGMALSFAGDINGDGYGDVLIGAKYNDAGGIDAGQAYLYTNSLTGLDIPDEFFTGEATGNQFGFSVSTAGDVNGDGYSDVIVGAYFNDAGGSDAGRAYIYFGGPSVDNVADVIMTGPEMLNLFGYSVSTAGDVNGDGYSDVIVGAYAYGALTGRAYIYYGGSSMDNVVDVYMTGELAGDYFGRSVSSAGDVNGDGYSDVFVGANNYSSGTGRAYIYYGGSSMNDVADVTMTGEAASNNFGISVSTAGDVNGDGYSDVIVGAHTYSSNTGQAYIYYGGSSMDNIADVTMTGEAANNSFGNSVSGLGDVNGDGYSDVIIGAKFYNAATGRAYIYYGGSSMNNVADVIMNGETGSDYFAQSVSTAGDVNGDGFDDIVVGAPFNDAVTTITGRAYIYFGGLSMDNAADITMAGEAANNLLGISVSGVGDVNGDGYSDVIVGAVGYSSSTGRAYLYLSSSPPIKPPLKSVKDIPFDQGGFVRVRWNRSGYDIPGHNRIADYILQRSDPPGLTGFVWDYVVTVPAIKASEYSYVSPTPYDSMTNTSGTFYFRVIARGTNPEEMWHSNIMYGHSVDNLAPSPPFNFYATLQTSQVKLGWKANTEEDFKNYKIYRSDTPVGDAFTLLTTTSDTTFIDTSPLAGNAYYYIQAYDVHDNGSPYSSDSIMAYLSANIRVILEGSYDAGGQMRTTLNLQGIIPLTQPYNTTPWNYTGTENVTSIPANVTDWVLVELRSTTTTVVDRRAAFLKNDGTLVDLDGVSNIKFPTATAGDYYVVIMHRNHLAVMTASPITISFSPTLYDMRTDLTKAYGTNAMKSLGGGYYGIYSADTDGSGTVNATDRSNTWNQRNLSGYYGTDVDLSGTVNAADRSSVWNNRNISTQVPTPVDGPMIKELNIGN